MKNNTRNVVTVSAIFAAATLAIGTFAAIGSNNAISICRSKGQEHSYK